MGAQLSSDSAQPIVIRTALHQPRTKVKKCQKCAERNSNSSSISKLRQRFHPSRQKLHDLEQVLPNLQHTRHKIYINLSLLPPELRLKIYEEVISPSQPPKICLQNFRLHHTLIDDAPEWIANEAYQLLLYQTPLILDQFPPWKYNISKTLLRLKYPTFQPEETKDRKKKITIQLSVWLPDRGLWQDFARAQQTNSGIRIRLKFKELWIRPNRRIPDSAIILLCGYLTLFMIFSFPIVTAWLHLGWLVGISGLLIPIMGVGTGLVLYLDFFKRVIRRRWQRHVVAWSLPVGAIVNMVLQAVLA